MKGRVAVRIAQVAPLHEAVPPKLYGGTERVVSFLTEELVALGHEVTLFASGDSRTAATLVPTWPRALFLGRIAPEKGPDRAIRIARAAGIPLRIAAKVSETDRAYFDAVIQPMIAEGGVEMTGEISDAEKPAFLCGAIGLLMPIDWPEPFGLVMIEAMACGTPVIAFDRGSVPEIIENGMTGFIVANEDEAVLALSRLPEISRAVVRHRFEQRFTARRMAKDYVGVYRHLVEAPTAVRDSQPAILKVWPSSQARLHGLPAMRRAGAAASADARLGSAAFIPAEPLAPSAGQTDAD
jgi:hypothetical protein